MRIVFPLSIFYPSLLLLNGGSFFTDNQMEEMVYRLGNMTLLEPHFNREIGNKSYSFKKDFLSKKVVIV